MESRRRVLLVLVGLVMSLFAIFAGEAHAIIGRPLTPLSFAGVARRTTRRAVYGAAAYGAYGAAPYPYYW
jgi:hypothetical protein